MPSSDRPGNRRRRGSRFEQSAAAYLEQIGFSILDRNYHSGHKEIDIIARRDQLIVFVEVKSAATDAFGHPAERVDRRKQSALAETARAWLQERDLTGFDYRFDVISFLKGRLEHFENAFDSEP